MASNRPAPPCTAIPAGLDGAAAAHDREAMALARCLSKSRPALGIGDARFIKLTLLVMFYTVMSGCAHLP